MNPTCNCGATLGAKNKSGCCRSCVAKRNNADPEIQRRRREAVRAHHSDPVVKAGYRERMRIRNENRSDAEIARLVEHGKRQYREVLSRPDVQARTQSAEAKAKRGRSVSATRYRDVPPEHHDTVRRLVRSNLATAAEARAIVRDQVAATERRRLAAMTPFERQMDRLANGAQLVEKPVLRRAEPDFTLGGVATGAL